MSDDTQGKAARLQWYRCHVEPAEMKELMKKSDARGFRQAILELLLFLCTGLASYGVFLLLSARNWRWCGPLLLLALFCHGTIGGFFGAACHELGHKTPFRTQRLNVLFNNIFAFFAWFDPVAYRLSHSKHHQVTAHHDLDGEVELPQGLDWHGIAFIVTYLTFDPKRISKLALYWVEAAFGTVAHDGWLTSRWVGRILAGSNPETRREHRIWARAFLIGQVGMAAVFALSGHWFLIIVFNLGCQYCHWLKLVCEAPQHVGLLSDSSDFRLCTRTYTCGWFPAFLYWNMQYHLEHHMFPAVPFYHLPRLRRLIEHDLPKASDGLWPTWRDEILPVLRSQRADSSYVFIPELPAQGRTASAV